MATRSMLDFVDETGDLVARLYHHWDGYPEYRLLNILNAVKKARESYDTSGFEYRKGGEFPDSCAGGAYISDLSGFYVLANKEGPGNVEIDNFLHGDIEYLYEISCKDNRLWVKILEPAEFEAFWDNPDKSNMKVFDEGYLTDLVAKICHPDQVKQVLDGNLSAV